MVEQLQLAAVNGFSDDMLPLICLENLTGVQFLRIAPLMRHFYRISFKGAIVIANSELDSKHPTEKHLNLTQLRLPGQKYVILWVTVCRM